MLDRSSSSTSAQTPIQGFTSGLLRVATAPLQLPLTMLRTSVQKNIVYGTTIGAVQGMGRGVGDVVGGTVQVLSNAIPSNPWELVSRKMAYVNAAR
jgi:hypothetical protein